MLLNARRFASDGQPSGTDPARHRGHHRPQAGGSRRADSEVRYRRLFETAKDGILILDADTGKIIDANPFMTDLLGYSHDEFLGKELWEIGLFRDKQASRAAYRELQEKGYIRYEHLPLETRSGQKVEVEFVSNVYQEDHQPSRSVQHPGHHRTQPLGATDAGAGGGVGRPAPPQGRVPGDAQSRTPQPARPHPQRRATAASPEEARTRLQQQARAIIERQVGQLTRLVDDLLEVSRITTGRIQLRQERVAVSGVVERAVETVRPLIDQRRHELTVSLPPQPIWLHADAARLEQVVVNLLTNAAKYTDEGGHIWLTVQQEGEEAVLRVRDTGVGIAPELLPRIFDLFTQAERSLDRSQGGLGIGLALVQRLVEMHGGTVEAYSALGQGSEFVVRLPVVLTPAPQPPSPPTETAQPTGPSLRVLVVDDNVDAADDLGDAAERVRA